MHISPLALLGLATSAIAASIPPVADSLITSTDYYLFELSLDEFLAIAAVKEGEALGLDWANDGCSSAPDTPFDFDFHNACVRHDFGYRNYKLQKRCGDKNKKRVDQNFKKDLLTLCESEEDGLRHEACDDVANVYYASVRVFGKNHFC